MYTDSAVSTTNFIFKLAFWTRQKTQSDLTRRGEWGSQTDNSTVGFSQLALLNSTAYVKCLAVSEWFHFSTFNKVINLHY